jgi:hypothetical protein
VIVLEITLLILLFALTTTAIGAAAGTLAARRYLANHGHVQIVEAVPVEADPFVEAEIDAAATDWAQRAGHPDRASLMANKLHMLYRLARERGQA